MGTREAPAYKIVTGRQDPAAVERLLRSLPDWFGIEESILDYVKDAATMPTYLALESSTGVDPGMHGRGIGSALVRAFEADARRDGARLLEVKT